MNREPRTAPAITLVETPDALEAAVAALADAPVIGFDTEFIPEKSYLPRLCLVQIGDGRRVWLIDPLALADLSPLARLLGPAGPMLVFHSGESDLLLLQVHAGTLPARLFDTQIAWALLSTQKQIGYARLAETLLRRKPPKGETISDWSRRPLPDEMRRYAAADVELLPALHERLTERLRRRGRLAWAQEEFAALAAAVRARDDGQLPLFRRIKGAGSLDRRGLAVLCRLDRWRRAEAGRRDRPLAQVLSDRQALVLAQQQPGSPAALGRLRGFPPRAVRHDGPALLGEITAALRSPPEDWPELAAPRIESPEADLRAAFLQTFVRVQAERLHVAPSVLMPPALLHRLAEHPPAALDGLPELAGWREQTLGPALARLWRGATKLTLAGSPPEVTLEESRD